MSSDKKPIVPTTVAPTKEAVKEAVQATHDDIEARIEAEVAKRLAAKAKVAQAPAPSGDLDERIATIVAKVIGGTMGNLGSTIGTAIMAAQQATQLTDHQKLLQQRKAKAALEEKCHICKQVVGDGKGRGCGGPWARNKDGSFKTVPVLEADGETPVLDAEGKPVTRRIEDPDQFHVKMVVFPANPMATKWFDGLKINNALYWSQGPNHEIWVPKVNDFASEIAKYTQNEIEQQVGRSHTRNFGGTISGRTGQHQGPGMGVGFN